MADQTVPSLTDRLAAYMVEAFLDGRGYDPGDKIDVEVTLKEGFHTVLTEMREDQAAGAATYDGLLPPPPGDGWWDTGHTPKACDCNHHWDAHTPFRGCSVCSCKKDPPNQPPPPPVAEGVVLLDGKRWRVIPSGFGYDDGSQSCRLVPIEGQVDAAERVQPPPHLTPEEVQEIRDWIATPPTSHVDDLIYRALRELSEIRQYEDPRDDGSYD